MDQTWWKTPEQLDEYQRAVIALPADGSHLVVGPPGSGKTNLLLLRAAYMVRNGRPNIAIITFNRLLREFLATGAGNYPFDAELITTFRTWGANLIRANGDEVETDGDFDEVRRNILVGLSDLRARTGDEVRYDCILLDEAQDYLIDEIDALRHFSDDIFAVGDNNQRIYQADGAIDHLKGFCREAPALRYHYRNGLAICRLADGIMNLKSGGMLDGSNYDEAQYASSVKRFRGLSLEAQVEKAVEELKTQLLAYPDEWIGVLAPLKRDVKTIYDFLSESEVGDRVQLQRWDEGYNALDHARPIIVSTFHSAKGLEYRGLHLMSFDQVTKLDHHQRLAYMAATRAKTSLAIYHNAALPGYMERGLVAVDGAPVTPPTLDELFGKSAS